ncbi:hypothetical protein BDZ89DRAFT_1169719 [Hymenopellis radicata]|nr:hypothetical protein BDZ89DRAFT_1169719 [Hymenopellis radicata]
MSDRIPLSAILSTTPNGPPNARPPSALSLAFDFLLRIHGLRRDSPPRRRSFPDITPVLMYILEDVLKGHPQLQYPCGKGFGRLLLRSPLRDGLDAICTAVRLVQLVGRVQMIAGDAKYKALVQSIWACRSGKIDMATHVKQLHELFLQNYPDIPYGAQRVRSSRQRVEA